VPAMIMQLQNTHQEVHCVPVSGDWARTGEAVAGGWCILGGTGNDFLGGVMGRNM